MNLSCIFNAIDLPDSDLKILYDFATVYEVLPIDWESEQDLMTSTPLVQMYFIKLSDILTKWLSDNPNDPYFDEMMNIVENVDDILRLKMPFNVH